MTMIERVARALCQAKGITPDSQYQHNFEGEWPTDHRQEYIDAFTQQPRVMLFHKAWRHYENAALVAIEAMREPSPETCRKAWGHPGSDGEGHPKDMAIYLAMIDAAIGGA